MASNIPIGGHIKTISSKIKKESQTQQPQSPQQPQPQPQQPDLSSYFKPIRGTNSGSNLNTNG